MAVAEVLPAAPVIPVAAKPAPPVAAALRRQLQPSTLRQQLLMLEILGKPLALRDDESVGIGE